jgi:hypothetical protein
MKRLILCGAAASLFVAMVSVSSAATNFNSSRSNIYRLTYPTDLLSQSQADAILADLDQDGPADQAKLKKWLASNFRKHGVDASRVKKIVVLAPDKERKEPAILLLTNPADEAQARATTVKSSKSNSSC